MLSNSREIFSVLSRVLCRAGLFVSYSDLNGSKKSVNAEIQALSMLMQILQKQHAQETFLNDLSKAASGKLDAVEHFQLLSDEEIDSMRADLQSVPEEIEHAAKTALDHFSKEDARLYTDILLSAAASVAQAYDEKDEMFLTNDRIVDAVTFVGNAQPLFQRLLMFFQDMHADQNAKYLYESNDLFDEMKISAKETNSLGLLSAAVRKAWLEKYPDDLNETVKSYVNRNK